MGSARECLAPNYAATACTDRAAQDLLVENSSLRRQLATATEKERRATEVNDDLRRQILLLQQQNEVLMASHRRFEEEFEQAGKMAVESADIEGDDALCGLTEGRNGFLEAKVAVLTERIQAMAKRSCWLQAQVESARDQAADARRRQVDAERAALELMQKGPGSGTEYLKAMKGYQPSQLPTGTDIWKEEKAFAEGLPKTIPAKAARCAALVTKALANGQSARSTVGRTVASTTGPNMAPTARPGNVWATLMNGGAAGSRVDFA